LICSGWWFFTTSKFLRLKKALNKIMSPRFAITMVLRTLYYNKNRITQEQIDTYTYFHSLPGAAEALSQTAKQLFPKDLETLTGQYKTITVPVLIIWGREDKVVPLEVAMNFKRDIPDSELVIQDCCKHVPPEEEPVPTREAIIEFLKK
jgi:pimeloyl-ACP methyl ester carboxylesterase